MITSPASGPGPDVPSPAAPTGARSDVAAATSRPGDLPEVTVVLPTHDRCDRLQRTLRSVLAQRDVELEVVVVDDGSRDGTWELLRTHPDRRIRPLRRADAGGVATARNDGIVAARAPWVAFVDDDDLWAPDKLALQLAAAEAAPDAGWVCVGSVEVTSDLEVLGWEPVPHPEDQRLILARNIIPGGGSGVMARTDLVRAVGGFDVTLPTAEDRELWIRLWLVAPLATVDRPLVAHVVHTASLSHRALQQRAVFDLLARRYADHRRHHQVAIDPSVLSGYGDALLLGGERAAAVRLYLSTALRHRQPKLWVKAAAAAVAPERLRRRWRAVTAEWAASLPETWDEELRGWLPACGAVTPSATSIPGSGTPVPGRRPLR